MVWPRVRDLAIIARPAAAASQLHLAAGHTADCRQYLRGGRCDALSRAAFLALGRVS